MKDEKRLCNSITELFPEDLMVGIEIEPTGPGGFQRQMFGMLLWPSGMVITGPNVFMSDFEFEMMTEQYPAALDEAGFICAVCDSGRCESLNDRGRSSRKDISGKDWISLMCGDCYALFKIAG